MPNLTERYLGDGVYASFDGYHIWLVVHDTGFKIALEPAVFEALVKYAEDLKRKSK